MKKIVILSAFLSPLRSGAEACAEEVPLRLCDQFDFVIITARLRSDLPREDLLQGKIPVIRVGLGLSLDKWLYPFLAPFAARRQKPVVIHAVLETFAGLALVFCRWTLSRRVKCILTCQTTNRSFLKGFIVRSPDIVTTISRYLANVVETLRKKNDVQVIPNGIDAALFRDACRSDTKVPGRILFVGRLEPMKRVDLLLRAFAFIDVPCHLRIVGDGSLRKSLEALAESLGISQRVSFAGPLPALKIPEEYAQAKVFCSLPRAEALGNVFIEAMASGCRVLASDVQGIGDVVQKASRVDPNASPQTIAFQLRTLLLEEDTVDLTLSETRAAPFDWRHIADRYASLY